MFVRSQSGVAPAVPLDVSISLLPPNSGGNTVLQVAFSVPIEQRRENPMNDFRDIQHGVNDPVDGVDVKRKFNDNQTPHERAQRAADVRSSAIPAADEEFLPEALRRRPTGPLNPRTGRRPAA
jgi:hypothetical protein